ncbi:testis-specific serine/threonine-protein kinase 5-like [Panthera leo]|uniref:testis-specific serine/threonine-protein kinase 5-like n=1 Tax=Panthera leo TaxID=9689 RepID=UPI001C6A294A|nr:testis-specific serine/threonine-protein kinase 5-like [Panthera leo]
MPMSSPPEPVNMLHVKRDSADGIKENPSQRGKERRRKEEEEKFEACPGHLQTPGHGLDSQHLCKDVLPGLYRGTPAHPTFRNHLVVIRFEPPDVNAYHGMGMLGTACEQPQLPAVSWTALPSVKGSARRKPGQRNFMEQVRECRDNGYLLSSRKMGSGAFSKVYLAYATHERMQHNAKLASDLRGKHHAMVAIKIISTAEAPVAFSQKFLPREISSLNATYKHLNVVRLYETYRNSQHSYLVLELAARGDLLEHINWVSERRCSPGLDEEEARRLFWQLVSAVAHCHSSGIVHRDLECENILLDDRGLLKLTDFGFASHLGLKSLLLSTFCGSVACTAPDILMSKYNGEQADLWSLGIIRYAMVTGKLPFKERQTHRMLHLMHHGPTFGPGVSPGC